MDYRQLGSSGLRVPVLSLGTGTFGGTGPLFGAWGTSDAVEARRLIDSSEVRAWIEGRHLIDLIETYPAKLSAQHLTDITRPLPPRAYSIASSRAEVGDEAPVERRQRTDASDSLVVGADLDEALVGHAATGGHPAEEGQDLVGPLGTAEGLHEDRVVGAKGVLGHVVGHGHKVTPRRVRHRIGRGRWQSRAEHEDERDC